jgi:hypothetical protein
MSEKSFRHPKGEWEVYEGLRKGLGADWILMAEIEGRLQETQNVQELDILLIHQEHGMILIEVKSYPMKVQGGKFSRSWGDPKDFNPLKQLKDQHQLIKDKLDSAIPGVFHKIREVLATPKIIERAGQLPDGWVDAQLLDSNYLSDVPAWIAEICKVGSRMSLEGAKFSTAVQILAPDAEFTYSPEGIRRIARANLQRELEAETKVLQSLDLNHRALVTGGAGSGKTMLAQAWAHRALGRTSPSGRKERVLFTCYNDPLAQEIRSQLGDRGEGLVVESFLRYVERRFDRPANTNRTTNMQDYWDNLVEEAYEHQEKFTEKFDTIIIDEAQDFESTWYPMLEALLDPEGSNRILMVADPNQNVRGARVGKLPNDPMKDKWALAELDNNHRNSAPIARFMRRHFDGASSSEKREPLETTVPIRKVRHSEDDALVGEVLQALEESDGGQETWVLTTNRSSRELLRSALGLVQWEQGGDGTVCESVRRVKGLEASRVIVVAYGDPDDEDDDLLKLVYAGVSRAIDDLVVVADPTYRKALRI